MHYIKTLTTVLVCTISLSGCKNTKSPQTLFEKEVQVNYGDLGINDHLIFKPYCMTVIDSFLIYSDNYGKKAFSAVNIQSGQLIRFGASGKEPGLFTRGDKINTIGNSSNLGVVLSSRQSISIARLDSFLVKSDYKPFITTNLKQDSSNILNMGIINDSLYLVAGNIKGKRFGLIDGKSGLVSSDINFPSEDEKTLENNHPELAYQLDMTVKPDKSKFAFITYQSGNLSIFNIENNNFKLSKELKYYNPDYKWAYQGGFISAIKNPKTKTGYLSIDCSDKYIYTLYSDSPVKKTMFTADLVLVYDWEGNPVKKIHLNKRVKYICVDKDDKTIYAIAKESPRLIYFNI